MQFWPMLLGFPATTGAVCVCAAPAGVSRSAQPLAFALPSVPPSLPVLFAVPTSPTVQAARRRQVSKAMRIEYPEVAICNREPHASLSAPRVWPRRQDGMLGIPSGYMGDVHGAPPPLPPRWRVHSPRGGPAYPTARE